MAFHEMSVQLNISTQRKIQDVSIKYRLSFNGTGWLLMWRSFGYTQSFTQQRFGVSAQARRLGMWQVINRDNWMIN